MYDQTSYLNFHKEQRRGFVGVELQERSEAERVMRRTALHYTFFSPKRALLQAKLQIDQVLLFSFRETLICVHTTKAFGKNTKK